MLDLLSDAIDWLSAIPWDAVGIGGSVVAAVVASLHFGRVLLAAWNRRRRREKLGEFLGEGQKLHRQSLNEKKPPPIEEAQDWSDRTEAYLAHLGSDYVETYNSAAGLPNPYVGSGSWSADRYQVESGLRFRLTRLDQFLEELRR